VSLPVETEAPETVSGVREGSRKWTQRYRLATGSVGGSIGGGERSRLQARAWCSVLWQWKHLD
jgi:hypothetical protein